MPTLLQNRYHLFHVDPDVVVKLLSCRTPVVVRSTTVSKTVRRYELTNYPASWRSSTIVYLHFYGPSRCLYSYGKGSCAQSHRFTFPNPHLTMGLPTLNKLPVHIHSTHIASSIPLCIFGRLVDPRRHIHTNTRVRASTCAQPVNGTNVERRQTPYCDKLIAYEHDNQYSNYRKTDFMGLGTNGDLSKHLAQLTPKDSHSNRFQRLKFDAWLAKSPSKIAQSVYPCDLLIDLFLFVLNRFL